MKRTSIIVAVFVLLTNSNVALSCMALAGPMPLICCSCYESLQKKKFEEYYLKRIWESLSLYLPSFFLLINPFPFNIFAVIAYIIFVLVIKVIIKQKAHHSLFLLDLIKGKKFYNKNFKDKIEST